MSHQRSVVFRACITLLAACILPNLPAMATPPDTTVVNYNQRLNRSTGELTVAIVRVEIGGNQPPAMSQIRYDVGVSNREIQTNSRGKARLRIVSAQNGGKYGGPKVWDIVYVHPFGSSHSYSGAGQTVIGGYGAWMHEFGHLLGTNEADTDIGGVHKGDGDSSSYEGKYSSVCFNAPQLHWIGWTDTVDCVRLNDLISDGQTIEVPIRPIDTNSETSSTIPIAYEYDVPGTTTREWISMPRSVQTSTNSIGGGNIFVYNAQNGSTESPAWWMPTTDVGRFGCTASNDNVVENLVINPISYVGKPATYKTKSGKTVETIAVSQAMLRISLAAP